MELTDIIENQVSCFTCKLCTLTTPQIAAIRLSNREDIQANTGCNYQSSPFDYESLTTGTCNEYQPKDQI